MPAIAIVVIGCLLLALVLVDVFRTVMWSSAGAGPITGLVTMVFRRGVVPLARRRPIALSMVGPLALASIPLVWAALLVVGFAFALQIDPDAVVHATTGLPADWSEQLYVAGYSVFTLGNGDFAPATTFGEVAFVLMSATGLLLMTLSVTYLIPVISASVAARSFASSVLSLGDSAAELVVEAWDGERIALDHQIRQWNEQLSMLGQQHLAYPVLHIFTGNDVEAVAPLAVQRVDETLTLLDAVDQRAAPERPARRQLRSSVESYVESFGTPVDDSAPPPDPPDLSLLRAAGIPLRADDDTFAQVSDALAGHRSRVHQVAGHDSPEHD